MAGKHVLIAGGSGMVGSLVLRLCLDSQDVSEVTAITRKSLGFSHDKLTEVIHQDFLDFKGAERYFESQDVCFYCIGVYTGQVNKEVFSRITVDYTRVFSTQLKDKSPQASFCFLSGGGADSTEKSRILFAREKGKAENIILGLNFDHTYVFRPGYIYPIIPRKEPNLIYKITRLIYKPMSSIFPNIGISSFNLAQKMVSVGLEGGERIIYENEHLRK